MPTKKELIAMGLKTRAQRAKYRRLEAQKTNPKAIERKKKHEAYASEKRGFRFTLLRETDEDIIVELERLSNKEKNEYICLAIREYIDRHGFHK